MLELANLVIELTGSRSKLVFAPLPKDDPTRPRPDIHLAKEKLGWTPTMPVRLGLAETIAYFDEILRDGRPMAPAAEAGRDNVTYLDNQQRFGLLSVGALS
jgi:UDP-glucuronate decarboxylase